MINSIFEPWKKILKNIYKVILDTHLAPDLMGGFHPIYKKTS